MKAKKRAVQSKAGCVAARLTAEQQTRIEKRADECGMTVSEWARMVLLEALNTSPQEHRLMTFMAAQTATIRVAMEQWQSGQKLTDIAVQASVEKLAAETAQAAAERMARRLAAIEEMEAA